MRRKWGLVAGLMAGLVALTGSGRADEADAVKALTKIGAQITVDESRPEKPAVAAILWGPGFKVEYLKDVKELKNLEKLRMGGPWITAAGIKELHGLKKLEILEVRGPNVSDAALKELQTALPKLKIRRASRGEIPFADGKKE